MRPSVRDAQDVEVVILCLCLNQNIPDTSDNGIPDVSRSIGCVLPRLNEPRVSGDEQTSGMPFFAMSRSSSVALGPTVVGKVIITLPS